MGVYKTGFATTQQAYEDNLFPLFEAFDRVEAHLAQSDHQPYLFGEHITEADCNLKMIRHDYPLIDRWYRNLYYDESDKTNGGAFKGTTCFDIWKFGYQVSTGRKHGITGSQLVIPFGPKPDIVPLDV